MFLLPQGAHRPLNSFNSAFSRGGRRLHGSATPSCSLPGSAETLSSATRAEDHSREGHGHSTGQAGSGRGGRWSRRRPECAWRGSRHRALLGRHRLPAHSLVPRDKRKSLPGTVKDALGTGKAAGVTSRFFPEERAGRWPGPGTPLTSGWLGDKVLVPVLLDLTATHRLHSLEHRRKAKDSVSTSWQYCHCQPNDCDLPPRLQRPEHRPVTCWSRPREDTLAAPSESTLPAAVKSSAVPRIPDPTGSKYFCPWTR